MGAMLDRHATVFDSLISLVSLTRISVTQLYICVEKPVC